MSLIIADGRMHFYQWDTGQQLAVIHEEGCEEVHFCHNGDEAALVCPIREEEGKRVADVPNILLQRAGTLMAYLSEETETGVRICQANSFCVKPRPKPEDYIYTETEILNYTSLSNRLEKLEGEGISQAVEAYLKENPVEAGATAEEAAQIQQNKQDIETLNREKLDADKLPEAVSDALAQAKASGEFKGDPGAPGEKGADGQPGADGKDYVLTDADKQEIAELAAEMVDVPESGSVELDTSLTQSGKAADAKAVGDILATLTLGQHSDGLIYTFIGGQPVGTGLSITSGEVVEPVYGDPVVDNAILSIAKGQTVQLGIMLSEEPTQKQTITVLSDSDALTFDKTKLTFQPSNWNVMQFVAVTAGDISEDTTAIIILRNSDELMTDTAITVYLTADAYSVDTTIPDGAHTVTIDDFESHTASGTDKVILVGYNAEYDNIYIPATLTVDGAEKTPILRDTTFANNTTIKYVDIDSAVYFSQYGHANKELAATFKGCTALVGVKYRGTDIKKMNNAFNNCASLKFFAGLENQIDCTTFYWAFNGCTSLEYVQDLSKLTKVSGTGGSATVGYNAAFSGCSSLKKVYGFPDEFESECSWDQTFNGCTLLESAVVPKNAKAGGWLFNNCTSLKRVDIYNDNLSTSDIISTTFSGCSDLTVYCNAGTTTHESLLSVYGSSTSVTIETFGGGALPSIVIWGDSTTSPGTPWKCWPDRLQEKLGTDEYLVKNEAASGEFTTSTSARQGGNAISVAAFTIPASAESVGITMTSEDGQTFSSSPVFSCGGTFNPCTIADVEGVISAAGTTPQTYKFTRKSAGSAVDVPNGTVVVSKADKALNAANNVMIIELGNNAGWNETPAVLLNQMQMMVDHFTENGGTKYILFGPFSGQFLRQTDKVEKVRAFESLATEAFGDHFISIRQYLIDNGLSDNGLEASALDTERMAKGQIPASLIGGGTTGEIKIYDGKTVTDDSHPNAYGANSIMLGIYAKGKELGYWQ